MLLSFTAFSPIDVRGSTMRQAKIAQRDGIEQSQVATGRGAAPALQQGMHDSSAHALDPGDRAGAPHGVQEMSGSMEHGKFPG